MTTSTHSPLMNILYGAIPVDTVVMLISLTFLLALPRISAS